MHKIDTCKCGLLLIFTNTKPVWVHCEDPYCDYVVMYGDYVVDRAFRTYSSNKFVKNGPKKGYYQGSPLLIHITDIKKNFKWIARK